LTTAGVYLAAALVAGMGSAAASPASAMAAATAMTPSSVTASPAALGKRKVGRSEGKRRGNCQRRYADFSA
jgi:hypothetical protein